MDWTWLLWQALFAFLLCFFAARKSRSSMQRYADDLRRAARELSVQSQQLTSVEETAKESRKESTRRAKELQTLRDRVASLSSSVAALTTERDAAREEARRLHARLAALSTQLAKSDARREILEKEITAASLTRLELLSKLRTDENERLSALNRLRHPAAARLPPFLQMSPGAQTVSSERALSPMAVAKSPSESMLLSLHPDLEISDDDDEFDFRQAERTVRELEERMVHKFPEADRLKPEGTAVRVRRKLEVPVVELGKPAVAAVAEQEEVISTASDQQTEVVLEDAGAEAKRGEELAEASPLDVKMQKEESAKAEGKQDIAVDEPDESGTKPTSPNASEKFDSRGDVTKESGAAVTSGGNENSSGELNRTSESIEAINSSEVSGLVERIKASQEIDLVEAVRLNETHVGELSETTPTSVESAEAFADVSKPIHDLSSALPKEVVNPAIMLSTDAPERAIESDSDALLDLSTISKRHCSLDKSPGNAFNELDEGPVLIQSVDQQSHHQILELKREASALRRGVSLDFDTGPLSLSRAPWFDTLNPVLQANDDAMSIASVLRPAITEKSPGIVPAGRTAHLWTSSSEGAQADPETNC